MKGQRKKCVCVRAHPLASAGVCSGEEGGEEVGRGGEYEQTWHKVGKKGEKKPPKHTRTHTEQSTLKFSCKVIFCGRSNLK